MRVLATLNFQFYISKDYIWRAGVISLEKLMVTYHRKFKTLPGPLRSSSISVKWLEKSSALFLFFHKPDFYIENKKEVFLWQQTSWLALVAQGCWSSSWTATLLDAHASDELG